MSHDYQLEEEAMTDPRRSPIAALAKKWRDDIAVTRRHEADCAMDYRVAEAYEEMAAELEAAIAAQVEVWDNLDGDFDDVNDAFDQVIADLRGEVVRTRKVMGEP